jgi:transcriptional regulator with XRE-family HTH domain
MPHRPFVRTLRAQWLGQQLRSLREDRGLTLQATALHLKRDMSALSRYERGEWPVGRADVAALLDLYGFYDAAERERMLRLAEEVWRTDRWSENYGDVVDASFIDFPWLESCAELVSSYHTMVVPGLFQLPEYAEIVIRAVEQDDPTDERVARWVDLRIGRQRVLDAPTGPRFEAIIDEAALRRRVGGSSLAADQLRHLGQVSRQPRVTIRVLPTDVSVHAGLDGSFWLFRMPRPYPAVAYEQILGGHIDLESPKSDRYVRAYDQLRTAALTPQESAVFIADLAEEMASSAPPRRLT